MREFLTKRNRDGMRFDTALLEWLRESLPDEDFSRGAVAAAIKAGYGTVDGVRREPDYRLRVRDVVSLDVERWRRERSAGLAGLEAVSVLEIEVLFEDENVLILNKPAGVLVHPVAERPSDTLAHWILAHRPSLAGVGENPLRPGIVHRLDRETSGVIVAAKTIRAFAELKLAFQNRTVEKRYLALVYGQVPRDTGTIEKPLQRKRGEIRRVVSDGRVEGARASAGTLRPARTEYAVVKRFPAVNFLLITPKTGRTHQIRVHMASFGHPVVGDKLYAFKPMRSDPALFPDRQMLHAWSIAFTLFGRSYGATAPLPADFQRFLRTLDGSDGASYADKALKSLCSV